MKMPLTSLLFCLALAGAATAQTWEISVSRILPRISSAPLGSISEESKKDDDTKLKGNYGYGGRLTWNTRGYYGHEIGYNYIYAQLTTAFRVTEDRVTTTTTLKDDITIRQASYNFLMYFMPKGERWRPFMTGGFHLHDYGAPGFSEWPTGKSRNYGFNYGGGIKLRVIPNGLLRLDLRDYVNGKPYDLEGADPTTFLGGWLRQLELSAGFTITF